jgi:hypothetical protein
MINRPFTTTFRSKSYYANNKKNNILHIEESNCMINNNLKAYRFGSAKDKN